MERNININEAEEVIMLKQMDSRLSAYEKYLMRLVRNYDAASELYEAYGSDIAALEQENSMLRQLAKDQNIDITSI